MNMLHKKTTNFYKKDLEIIEEANRGEENSEDESTLLQFEPL